MFRSIPFSWVIKQDFNHKTMQIEAAQATGANLAQANSVGIENRYKPFCGKTFADFSWLCLLSGKREGIRNGCPDVSLPLKNLLATQMLN